ncbi:hypothetical protein ACJRO7_000845 [Eucalyptus globulus]|uniref:Uncharacterized protein n=1 Tax=Eucalyptus globulus TaxID=34317 RepID=A0ABD3LP03_EUCGL
MILGNFLANQLLLKSSLKNRSKFQNFYDTLPQKQLELRWKKSKSASRPSSFKRFPEMSPWLRPMPVMVLTLWSLGRGSRRLRSNHKWRGQPNWQ